MRGGCKTGYYTHLTVNWGRHVHSGKANNQAHESGHACNGVNLPKEWINLKGTTWHLSTYPYRPPVGETAPNNLPLVVKGVEELPAGYGGLCYVTCAKPVKTHA